MAEVATKRPPRVESIDTYQIWQERQKIPRVTGFSVEDIKKVEVAPWKLKGGLGAFVNLERTGGINDGYVCVIPPGAKLKPQKHLYEEMVYVVEGSGATTVWQRGGRKQNFEWQAGSLFAIPLNAWYQHHNGSGSEAVRYFAVTNAPMMINIFHNLDFVFDVDFAFLDRFDPEEEDYFTREGKVWGPRNTMVNFNDGEGPGTSVKEGGGQIEYEDEDPKIHREFEAELAEAGARCMMGSYHPNCAQSR